MNAEDLLEAIGETEEALLEKTERNYVAKRKLSLFAAVAACLCLVIGIISMMRKTESLPGHQISSEKITWNMEQVALIKNSSVNQSILETDGPAYQFAHTMSIEAQVIEVLPDTYAIAGASTGEQRYKVLLLKVKDVIVGEGFPDKIYYLLPNTMDPDLTEYDSLILNMSQVGMENYLLINVDKQRAETFDYVFWREDYAPEYGAILAFRNEKLDLGLWDKAGWGDKKSMVLSMIERQPVYPGKVGRSIEATKKAIRELAEQFLLNETYQEQRSPYIFDMVASKEMFAWPEAKEILAYVAPFENGTFSQHYGEYGCGSLRFQRIINGFGTNEIIYLDADEKTVHRYGAPFTQEDMSNLPDLVSVIENLSDILPPEYTTETAMKKFCGVEGAYHKVDGAIYGVVTVLWGNPNYEEPKGLTDLLIMPIRERMYILVLQDGTHRIVSKEELKQYIG